MFKCDDCRKVIKSSEDELSYFDSYRCLTCSQGLAQAMSEANAEELERAKQEFLLA